MGFLTYLYIGLVRRSCYFNTDFSLVCEASVVPRGCRPCSCRRVNANLDLVSVAKVKGPDMEEDALYDTLEVRNSSELLLSGKSVL